MELVIHTGNRRIREHQSIRFLHDRNVFTFKFLNGRLIGDGQD